MDLQLTFTAADAATLLAILQGPLVAWVMVKALAQLDHYHVLGRWARVALVALVAGLGGFLTVYATGDLSRGPVSVVQALGLSLSAAVVWYENYLKPSIGQTFHFVMESDRWSDTDHTADSASESQEHDT